MVFGWRMATLLSSEGDSSTINRFGLRVSACPDPHRLTSPAHDFFCLRMAVAVESSATAWRICQYSSAAREEKGDELAYARRIVGHDERVVKVGLGCESCLCA
jgi:hypothetical protein